MTIAYRGTTALITGASSGLGEQFARQFAARGANVVLVARRFDRLTELCTELAERHSVTATPVAMDLGRADAAAALRTELTERGLTVDTLVNNAGFGMKGAFVDAAPERIAEMVQVNVATLVALTREFLPDILRTRRGAVVTIASTGAYQPCPNMAVYGASKAFVLSFTEAIAFENRGSGVPILCVSPGATRTEFFDHVGGHASAVGRFETTETVVTRALEALDRRTPPASFVSGTRNAVLAKLAAIMPRRATLALSGRVLR